MNLKPIVDDLHKLAFTLPGIEKDDLIKVDDVILILRNHLEFYDQEGSALVHFPDGKVVEKTYSGRERSIKPAKPKQRVFEDYGDRNEVEDADIPEAEAELPPEILANLNSLQSGTVDEHSQDRKQPPPGTAPA